MTPIFKATRKADNAIVFIVGEASNDRVWVSPSLAHAHKQQGRSDFASKYDIDGSAENEEVYF